MRKRPWSWRKLGKITLCLALISPPALFGVSNLFLNLPIGRNWVAGRIQSVVRLETSISGASWSPWNGFTLKELRIHQPAPLRAGIRKPLLTVESVRVLPGWKNLLKRRLEIRAISVRRPELSLPIEILALIPAQPPPPTIASRTTETLARNDTPAPSVPYQPQEAHSPAPKPTSPPAPEVGRNNQATLPTVWIDIEDASFNVVTTLRESPLYTASEIHGRIPVGGKDAQSTMILNHLAFMGMAAPDGVEIPLKWNAPFLEIGTVECAAYGIRFMFMGKAALLPGLPFQVIATIPPQQDRSIELPPLGHATMGALTGRGRFQGQFTSPSSWQGETLLQAGDIRAEIEQQSVRFSQGQAIALFQGGVLRIVDARMIGEETSLLGNATFRSDGRFSAVARCVASPERLQQISSRFPQNSAVHLTPLSTPQRAALDMKVFGSLQKPFFQPHPQARPIPLR